MGKIYEAMDKKELLNKIENLPNKNSKTISLKKLSHKNVIRLIDQKKKMEDSAIDHKLATYHQPHSLEADLFNALRTKILFPEHGKPRRSILVTSALPDDGKSFISANLSITLARGIEEKVLLIDCDIRRPTIHRLFGINQEFGLSEYLSSNTVASEIITKSIVNNLSILPAGKPPLNPTELLTSKKMRNLLYKVRARYNDLFIIVDSPPPAMAPETLAITKFVDGVIVVVKAGKTHRKAVADVVDAIGKEKIIGLVLNHAEKIPSKYYGHTRSYYGQR